MANDSNIKWGMVIDLDKCSGCGSCISACQIENNVAPVHNLTHKRQVVNWLIVLNLSNQQSFPEHQLAYLPKPCQQCENPPCVSVCPVTATDKNPNGGIVSQIPSRCIGCRYCMVACPYHARYFNWFDPSWPDGMENTLNPDVAARPRGVVEKCLFCHQRLMLAKQQAYAEDKDPENLPEQVYQPACAEACPNKAIFFGDLNNKKHKVHALAKSEHCFSLLTKLKAKPQVYYLSKKQWLHDLADNHLKKENNK